jgi:hypothetical protein
LNYSVKSVDGLRSIGVEEPDCGGEKIQKQKRKKKRQNLLNLQKLLMVINIDSEIRSIEGWLSSL